MTISRIKRAGSRAIAVRTVLLAAIACFAVSAVTAAPSLKERAEAVQAIRNAGGDLRADSAAGTYRLRIRR
ncbi:MAG TPA: hypothetical protein VF306_17710 [Pirellulales bacterium]